MLENTFHAVQSERETGELRLARAVIEEALFDVRFGIERGKGSRIGTCDGPTWKQDAIEFFVSGDDLDFWADAAGLSAPMLRDGIIRILDCDATEAL